MTCDDTPMMHRTSLALLLSTALAFSTLTTTPAFSAAAEESLGIAAVVNDEVITSADVEGRVRLVLATTGISGGQETAARLRPQILRALADETLQLQEATRLGIEVTPNDITQAIAAIEQQRQMPAGSLKAHLQKSGVPEETLENQLRAQIAWTRAIMKTVRPKIKISEEELEASRLRFAANQDGNKVEALQIAVLALPVDKPERDAQVRALAEKLVAEIRGGAAFEAVARELSSNASSPGTATAFWVEPTQLDPNVAKALMNAPPGTISPPLRTPDGYTVIKLVDKRNSGSAGKLDYEVMLKDILLRLKETAPRQEVELMLGIGAEVGRHPGDCTSKGIADIANVDDFDIEVNWRRTLLSQLPPAMQQIVSGLSVSQVSEPFATDEGIRLFMLCERTEAGPRLADREETQARLMQEKLELEAQKILRNLRREAFIEIRDGE